MRINYENLPEWPQPLGKDTINDLRFSPNGDRIVVVRNYSIFICDAQNKTENVLITGHIAPVTALVFSAEGSSIISVSEDGNVRISEVSTGRNIKSIHDYEGDFIAFSPDAKSFATKVWAMQESEVEKIHLYDIDTCTLEQTFNANDGSGFLEVVFSPDGKTLAMSEYQRNTLDGPCPISLWDITTGSCLKTLTVVNGGAFSIVFSPDGHILADGGGLWDRRISLWDIATGQCSQAFWGGGGAESIAFSSDGCILATGYSDGVIMLWDVTTGKRLKTMTNHTGKVNNLCFSPDSYTLVSGCEDGIVLLWE